MAKIGIEVEGRFTGLKTLFLSALEFSNEAYLKKALELGDKHTDLKGLIKQVYISDLDNHLDLVADPNLTLYELSKTYIVTVEVSEVREETPEYINIMLNIGCPSFWNLSEVDQFKFSDKQHVFSASVANMSETLPEDFAGDITLDITL